MFGETTYTKIKNSVDLYIRNTNILKIVKRYSILMQSAKNISVAIKSINDLRLELMNIDYFGYVRVDNIIQLGAMCGFLPAVSYTHKNLPITKSSGSNRFLSSLIESNDNKKKQKVFNEVVTSLQKCTSKRIYSSDIENVMCELDRDSRNRRKMDCIFLDKTSMKVQNFFRIFKTNISRYNSVMKYQVQIFSHRKWVTLEQDVKPIYKFWLDEEKLGESDRDLEIERVTNISIRFNEPFEK